MQRRFEHRAVDALAGSELARIDRFAQGFQESGVLECHQSMSEMKPLREIEGGQAVRPG
ncbi:MAG: hypothetical protein WA418_37195 [Bradyrhizobium sp.]